MLPYLRPLESEGTELNPFKEKDFPAMEVQVHSCKYNTAPSPQLEICTQVPQGQSQAGSPGWPGVL